MPLIIGITGVKRAGKDSVARILEAIGPCVSHSFAQPLKACVGQLFRLQPEQLHGDQKEEVDERYNVSARQLLQVVGTDLFRDTLKEKLPNLDLKGYPTLWCFLAALRIDEHVKNGDHTVISDVRFKDEAKMIKEKGGIIIRVERPSLKSQDTHKSEQEQAEIEADHTIVNDGDLSDLEVKVKELYGAVLDPYRALKKRKKRPIMMGLVLDDWPISLDDLKKAYDIQYGEKCEDDKDHACSSQPQKRKK